MIVVRTAAELREAIRSHRDQGCRIGFVPTMGALHDGHLSLVDQARDHANVVVVSIFVNPTQFGPNEDYRIYPRDEEKDCRLLAEKMTDIVFMPSVAEMYPAGAMITVNPGPVGDVFEGKIRPNHFQGVLTVVAKLFHLVLPDSAIFGQKDAQQLFLIRKMVKDLNFPLQIIEGDTVREADGLARSSRNVYLKVAERKNATVLFQALTAGKQVFQAGNRSLDAIQQAMRTSAVTVPEFQLDYATAVSDEAFAEADPVSDASRLIIAGRLGSVRLIDNMRFF
jgi:pantoate--beta-alanine ligase